MRLPPISQQVEQLLTTSSEFKLQKAATALHADFEDSSLDLRASLNSFVQTQRAIYLARLVHNDDHHGDVGETDDETNLEERIQQLERLAAIIKFRAAAMLETLSAESVENIVQSQVAKKIQPRLAKAIVFSRDALKKLIALIGSYMTEGKAINYDFERVGRDMSEWTESLVAEMVAQQNAAQAAADAAAMAQPLMLNVD